jgi:uncharacterized membrane protein
MAAQGATTSLDGLQATGRSSERFVSIDVFRGLIMALMALDHVRDFFTNLRFEPEALQQTYSALFATRWVTHFCAPMFFFLAGTSAFLYGQRHTRAELRRFLLTRGLWLIALEFTIIGTAWSFQIPFGFFGVIWALGASMVIMAVGVRLPMKWLAMLAALMVVGHDLLDRVRPAQFGAVAWMWTILHVRGSIELPFHFQQFVLFPLVPLVGVMAIGFVCGRLYLWPHERRRRRLVLLGVSLSLMFVLLRLTNLYGNPPAGLGGVSQGDWHIQSTIEKTIILFFDVEKYPPSLQFLLMTIGPSLLLLAWMDRKPVTSLLSPLLVFGRVPMFFYVLHLYLIHWLAILIAVMLGQPVRWLFRGAIFGDTPEGYGYGLGIVYLMWTATLVFLYLPCRWFADIKQRRREWWLSYV